MRPLSWVIIPLLSILPALSPGQERPSLTVPLDSLTFDRVYLISKVLRLDRVNNQVEEGLATDEPKYPKQGEEAAVLGFMLKARDLHGRMVLIGPWGLAKAQGLIFQDIRLLPPGEREKLKVTWYKVEPTRGKDGKGFSNEQWILKNGKAQKVWAWDTLRYQESVWDSTNSWTKIANVCPVQLDPHDFGTMRFKVEVSYRGQHAASGGAEKVEKDGEIQAHRVSVRGNSGNDLLDWACSLFNLPYIWGSASITRTSEGHQAEKYIGADCADFVVCAARRAGYEVPYKGSQYLKPYTLPVAKPDSLNLKGEYLLGGKTIPVDDGDPRTVHTGDLLLWSNHVAMFAADNGNGILDAGDEVVQILFHEPARLPIREAFAGSFAVVRFKPGLKRAR
jgi:cell wall-associated NlpC family hydrolase